MAKNVTISMMCDSILFSQIYLTPIFFLLSKILENYFDEEI